MKIAIVTPVFPPYRGGIGVVAREQAEAFSDSGNSVTVFTPAYGKDTRDKNHGVKYSVTELAPFFKYGNAALLPQLFFKLHGFDKIILHYPFFGGAEFFIFKPGIKDKLIIFYHMDVFGQGLMGLFFRFHTKYILPLILARTGKIIVTSLDYATSGALKNLFRRQPERFTQIPLCVDTQRFAPRPRDLELLVKLNIAPRNKIILFVGGLDSAHYFKGVDVLLNAYKKFISTKSYTLVIVGDGNLRVGYEKLAKELGIGDQVIFAGSVSEEDLPKYYNLADLFILPSIDSSEAFGLVVLEALSSGVPVIASNLPGVRTLIKEGITGYLVSPGDSEDLALKITTHFSNLEKAQTMEKETHNAAQNYSDKSVSDRWNKIIINT